MWRARPTRTDAASSLNQRELPGATGLSEASRGRADGQPVDPRRDRVGAGATNATSTSSRSRTINRASTAAKKASGSSH